MTVIATDGRTIAADSLTMFGAERAILPAEKIRVVGESIYALSGHASVFEALIEWHQSGASLKDAPKYDGIDWGLIVISRDGVIRYASSSAPIPFKVEPPWAIGVGADYANGAMRAGASPARAVEIACEVSTACGGPVRVVDIVEALGPPVSTVPAEALGPQFYAEIQAMQVPASEAAE